MRGKLLLAGNLSAVHECALLAGCRHAPVRSDRPRCNLGDDADELFLAEL